MSVKAFDLSSYLEEKKSTIKLGDEVFEVSDGFNDLLKIDALANRKSELESADFIKEFLTISLGEDAATKLIERNYPIKLYIKVMNCIEEIYSGDSNEEQEGASSQE